MKTEAIEVKVEPSVLIWARTSLGLSIDEAAKTSHLGGTVIEMLENGSKRPDISMLEALASAYKRPTAALLLPRPPVEPPLPEDFRSLPQDEPLPLTERTLLAMRRARRLQAIAGELRERTNTDLSERVGDIHAEDDPEDAAIRLRDALGISYDVQRRWKDSAEAFDGWRTAIEKLDIYVLKIPMEMKEARAFSLVDGGIPVIAVNSRDSPNGMIFSLLHELGHVVLYNDGLCIPTRAAIWEFNPSLRTERRRIEVFCNHVAGAILVPREHLARQSLVRNTERRREWSDRELGDLARTFHVSREVILRRILSLGKTSTNFYKQKHEEWAKKGEPTGPRGGGGGRRMPQECVSQSGRPFVSLVIESYRNERITYNDVADYLKINVKHIPRIEKLIEAH